MLCGGDGWKKWVPPYRVINEWEGQERGEGLRGNAWFVTLEIGELSGMEEVF